MDDTGYSELSAPGSSRNDPISKSVINQYLNIYDLNY